jgi:hypothetical protein
MDVDALGTEGECTLRVAAKVEEWIFRMVEAIHSAVKL